MKKATIELKNKIPKNYSGMTPEEVLTTDVKVKLTGVFNFKEVEVLVALIQSWHTESSDPVIHKNVK